MVSDSHWALGAAASEGHATTPGTPGHPHTGQHRGFLLPPGPPGPSLTPAGLWVSPTVSPLLPCLPCRAAGLKSLPPQGPHSPPSLPHSPNPSSKWEPRRKMLHPQRLLAELPYGLSLLHAFNLGRGLWPGNKKESPPGQPCPPSPSHTSTWGAPPVSSALAISTLKDAVISSSQLCPTRAP